MTNVSTVYSLTSPTCPSCVYDKNNTFYYGYVYEGLQRCEDKCAADVRCVTYTYYSMDHPDYRWSGECLGTTDYYNISVPEAYTTSGRRMSVSVGESMLVYGCVV